MKKLQLSFALPFLLLAACTTDSKDGGAIAATPAMATKLAAADAADGKVDKVVHKCAGCSLGMDGKAEMALHVGEYEMHFCKDACVQKFATGTEAAVMALKVPE